MTTGRRKRRNKRRRKRFINRLVTLMRHGIEEKIDNPRLNHFLKITRGLSIFSSIP
jgi:hypothetical protein